MMDDGTAAAEAEAQACADDAAAAAEAAAAEAFLSDHAHYEEARAAIDFAHDVPEKLATKFWSDKRPTWRPTREEYYFKNKLIGSSALAQFRESRRLYEQWCNDAYEKPVTDAMTLGSLVDMILTEPEELARTYAVTSAVRRGTKAWREDQDRNQGRTLVKEELMKSAKKLVQAISEHPIAGGIMRGEGASQVVNYWNERGVGCKARFDRVFNANQKPAFADLKCWNVIEPEELGRQIYQRGTHRQMAFYERGFEELWGVRPQVFLVVVNSKEPHEVAVKVFSEKFLALGRRDVEQDLEDLRTCLDKEDFSNSWETNIETVEPPPWAK